MSQCGAGESGRSRRGAGARSRSRPRGSLGGGSDRAPEGHRGGRLPTGRDRCALLGGGPRVCESARPTEGDGRLQRPRSASRGDGREPRVHGGRPSWLAEGDGSADGDRPGSQGRSLVLRREGGGGSRLRTRASTFPGGGRSPRGDRASSNRCGRRRRPRRAWPRALEGRQERGRPGRAPARPSARSGRSGRPVRARNGARAERRERESARSSDARAPVVRRGLARARSAGARCRKPGPSEGRSRRGRS